MPATPTADASANPTRRQPSRPRFRSIALSTKPAAADEPPIACTLSAGSMKGRLADWNALLAHVERREPIDGGVRSVFAPSVPITDLMRLVAAEQDCCQFFRFAITVDTRGVALEVRAPEDALLDRRVDVRVTGMNAKKENATIIGVGVAACAVCCAGPILGVLAAIGLGTAAGFALFGTIAIILGAALVAFVLVRRRRRAAACHVSENTESVAGRAH